MRIEQVSITHHGRTVDGDAYWPDTTQPTPAVILSHGYGGTKEGAKPLAMYLAERGVAAVCITLCGGSNADTSGFPTTAMTVYTERDDILATLDWLRNHARVKPDRIILYGESQGGMASMLASLEAGEHMLGLAMLYPALCIPDDWRQRFPKVDEIPETYEFWGMMLGEVYPKSVRELYVFDVLAAYHGPVLIMHGEQDQVVPVSYAQKAAELYDQAELHLFPTEKHGFTPEGTAKVCELLYAFVQRLAD